METPRNTRSRPQRSPTPKISERRKSLFKQSSIQEELEESAAVDVDMDKSLDGIDLLPEDANGNRKTCSVTRLLRKNTEVISFLKDAIDSSPAAGRIDEMFDNIEKSTKVETLKRRSPRHQLKTNNATPKSKSLQVSPKSGKENALATPKNSKQNCCTDELQNLFSNSMSLKPAGKKTKPVHIKSDSSEENTTKKRPQQEVAVETSQAKIRKLDFSTVGTTAQPISTKCFYSGKKLSPKKSPPFSKYQRPHHVAQKRTRKSPLKSKTINRGVHHGIRRPKPTAKKVAMKTQLKAMPARIDNKQPAQPRQKGPVVSSIEMSDTESETDFNVEYEDDSADDFDFSFSFSQELDSIDERSPEDHQSEIADDGESAATPSNRKFFKSGRTSTKKEVQITSNIKATMSDGKLKLLAEEKKKSNTQKKRKVKKFSVAVDNIIKTLDTSELNLELVEKTANPSTTTTTDLVDPLYSPETMANYGKFRARLPYNTSDPVLIEQQHLLLDFLITNKICTEKNFEIFIADPDNHKEEAAQLVDNIDLVVMDNQFDDFKARIPYNTTDAAKIELQRTLLDFLITNNICTEQNFEIFIADYENRREEADQIVNSLVAVAVTNDTVAMEVDTSGARSNGDKLFPIFYPGRCQPIAQKSTRKTQRRFIGGYGVNQYQIDAGQKEFGARQCKQCGLLYTVHEPEEERLHEEYHQSMHILRFKGWIDEDVVISYPEWSVDGRIIRVTSTSHIKRRERVREVLKVVDTELGFSSYIIPNPFVCFFAVRKNQIVGLCLVQPLKSANKYICLDGIDCCSEEFFEARCGISRIWVSPFHRRFHIGQKLFQAVQSYTFLGETVPIDKISFSAPTEDGKGFAKKVTKNENFLVYQ